MATVYPDEFRRILEKCGQLSGDAAYDCLRPNIPDYNSMRSLREVLIRAAAIYVISFASYGHLLSLQGLTNSRSAELWLRPLAYLFFPILPAVELVRRISRVCVRALRGGRAPIRYWIAAVAGSCTVVSGIPRRLDEIEPSELRFTKRKRNLVWCGRIIVLLSVLAQCVGSLAIWYRSLYLFSDRWNDFREIDKKTSDMVWGSAVSVLNSLLITFLNTDWEYNQSIEPIHLSEVDQRLGCNNTRDICPVTESYTTSVSTPSNVMGPMLSTRMERILSYIYERNEVLAVYLSKYFPEHFQFTVEHALVAQSLVAALDPNLWITPVLECDPFMSILTRETPNTYWRFWCAYSLGIKERRLHLSMLNRVWYAMRQVARLVNRGSRSPGNILPVVFYLVIARILLVNIVSLLALSRSSTNLTHRVFFQRVEAAYTWLLGGRTILSFPIALTGILFHAVLRIIRLAAAINYEQHNDTGDMNASREDWVWLMFYNQRYRDPWYDSMLVL